MQRPALSRMLLVASALLVAGLVGCVDEPARGDGPHIDSVSPDPVDPQASLRIEGDGFGEAEVGSVAIGGRPVRVRAWSAQSVEVVVPIDQPGGATYVVLTAAGRPSRAAPLFVTGDQVLPDGGRRYPDGGVRGDGGRLRDQGPRDGGPDAARSLVAEFLPDPGNNGVRLVGVSAEPGFITLKVEGPATVWGAAFHLTYDRNLLRLDRVVAPALDTRHHTAEIANGRVAFGRVFNGARATDWVTLRFRITGRGETRVDFPPRHRSVREAADRTQAAGWTGGTVRVTEVER